MAAAFNSTHFSSPMAFQKYFDENVVLQVPAGQSLEIEDIARIEPVCPYPLSSNVQKIFYVFKKIIYPLGVSIDFLNESTNPKWAFSCNSHKISLSSQSSFKVLITDSIIRTSLHSLLRTMFVTNRLKMELSRPHILITSLKAKCLFGAESVGAKSEPERITNVFSYSFENNFGCSINLNWNGYASRIVYPEHIFFSEPINVKIISEITLDLSIKLDLQFLDICDFQERIQLHHLMKAPLIIENDSFLTIYNFFSKTKDSEFNCLDLLNTFLTIKGLKINCAEPVRYSIEDYALKVYGPLTLKIQETNIIVDLKQLAKDMTRYKTSSINVQAPHSILIKISEEDAKKPSDTTLLTEILEKNNTPILKWDLSNKEMTLNTIYINKGYYLKVSPENLKLSLIPLNGDEVLLNIIKDSHPELKRALIDCEIPAYNLLLIKTFLFYTLLEFDIFPLPSFFKKVTREKLFLLQCDTIFNDALLKMQDDPLLREELDSLLNLSPDKFDSTNRLELSPNIQIILSILSGLASEEMQGGIFLQSHLQNYVQKELECAAASAPFS